MGFVLQREQSVTNPNKAKGTRWESTVRDFLQEERCLDHARRIAQTGTLDIGDIHMEPFALQAKNQKAFDLSRWVSDAEVQAERAGLTYGVAVVKAPRKPTERGYVVMSLGTFRRLAAELIGGEVES